MPRVKGINLLSIHEKFHQSPEGKYIRKLTLKADENVVYYTATVYHKGVKKLRSNSPIIDNLREVQLWVDKKLIEQQREPIYILKKCK